MRNKFDIKHELPVVSFLCNCILYLGENCLMRIYIYIYIIYVYFILKKTLEAISTSKSFIFLGQ